MKKIATILVVFLMLSASLFFTRVESYPTNRLFLEKENHFFSPLLIMRQNFNSRFQEHYSRILNHNLKNNDEFSDFIFSPVDIELKDDAFHGAETFHFAEWWYFDARLDNGFSLHMSVCVMTIINQGIIFLNFNLYKDGNLISHNKILYDIADFYSSTDVPLIILDGKEIMTGYINETNGDWIYDISFENDEVSINLQFVGCTKGWKGRTPFGGWGVILPRADVTGTIRIKNQEINVSGIGYHDHNWEVTILTALNFGWFWGKINTNDFTVTWSTILKTCFLSQPLIVINEKDGEYLNIESEDIEFTAKDLQMNNGRIIPKLFIINAHNENVTLRVEMEVLDTHHVRLIGIVNYWRHHVKCSGSITINDHTEIIDEIEIAEYFRLR